MVQGWAHAGCRDTKQLGWLDGADPISDANTNFRQGNMKLFAVYGFTIMLPGLDSGAEFEQKESGNYIPIEGTADDSCDRVQNEKATEYAKLYNQKIMELSASELP